MSSSPWEEKKKALDLILSGEKLANLNAVLRADREVVLAAIQQRGGRELEYASESLQGDKEVVMAAVQKVSRAMEYASREPDPGSKEVLMAAFQDVDLALKYATPDLQGEKEVVMAAVQNVGVALKYATPKLQGDKELVMAAVQNVFWALAYATPTARNDAGIVSAAIKQAGTAKVDRLFSKFDISAGTKTLAMLCALQNQCAEENTTRSEKEKLTKRSVECMISLAKKTYAHLLGLPEELRKSEEEPQTVTALLLAEVIYLGFVELTEVTLEICDVLGVRDAESCTNMGCSRSVALFLAAVAEKNLESKDDLKIAELLSSYFKTD